MATGTARWHRSGSAPLPLRWVLRRDPAGKRPPAARCGTDPTVAAVQRVAWLGARWHLDVTCAAARAHLGIAPQRPWRTRARGRTTPGLRGRCSLAVLGAKGLHPDQLPTWQAAWDATAEATFAAALAAVRTHLRAPWNGSEAAAEADLIPLPRPRWDSLSAPLAYAA